MSNEAEAPLLASLLEDEYFLLKVLEKLVEYGLHECRLVCRKWRDSCQQLSLELTLKCHQNSLRVLSRFPNVKRAKLRGGWGNEGHQDEVKLCEKMLHELKSCASLQSFSTAMRVSVLLSELVPSRKFVFGKLRSLTMGAWFHDNAAGDQLVSCLQHLTLLTRLEIHGRVQNWRQPATGLKHLRHLTANISFIVNEQQRLCFPALTQLTHLGVLSVEPNQNLWRRGRFLTVLRPYQGSLRSLSLSASLGFGEVDGIAVLTEFQKLQALSFYLRGEHYDEFFSIRQSLAGLKALNLGAAILTPPLMATIFSLTGLRSLSLCDIRTTDGRLYNLLFSRFAHLKELSIKRADIGDHWRLPTSLTKLHIEGRRGSCKSEIPVGYIASSDIVKLQSLEELTIQEFCVDEDLFATLAQLPALINLRLAHLSGLQERINYQQLKDVNKLERLTIGLENSQGLLKVLKEGALVHLRYLDLLSKRVSRTDTVALLKALPCLRAINSSSKA